MTKEEKKPTRKFRQLRVPVLPEEEATIKRSAADTGLTVAAYLRNIGLGYKVPGILDNKRVEELSRINGDLGRMGGLLKLWLSDDPRAAKFGPATIRAVLNNIEATQEALRTVIRKVVLPRTER